MFDAGLRALAFAVLAFVSLPAVAAQPPAARPPDPRAVLAAAKAASGGNAWDRLSTQHSRVSLTTGGLNGSAERWSDVATGRSWLRFDLGAISGAQGFDGKAAWSQDASGQSRVENADNARELAVNAAYRDRLAFWFPQRGNAKIEYRERANADGADFDVVRITPEGGRPYDVWVNTDTKLIERLVEREDTRTRTEIYMDFRDVQGVKIPFRVRANRGDPRFDDLIVVESIEFNRPLTNVSFDRPPPPKPDFAFPAGAPSVDVPFEVHNGHLFVRVTLNGKGPYRMLFDSGGVNVVTPRIAAELALAPKGAVEGTGVGNASQETGFVTIDRVEVAGVRLERQSFATIDLDPFMQRVEGLDDVAGLVGYELFKRFPVRLDYERGRATFYEPTAFKYAGGGTRLPFRFKGHIPQVDGSVDGLPGAFDIDTGSRGSLTIATPFAEKHDLATKLNATKEAISGAGLGGRVRARMARVQVLKLGDVENARPVTALASQVGGVFADPALAGNVGYGVLRRFNVTFDYANQVLWLERNASFGTPDVADRAGMWIERGEKGFVVIDVVDDSPAAAAGLRAGDVIVEVDRLPYSATTLNALRQQLKGPAGTRLSLGLANGQERTLTLRDII